VSLKRPKVMRVEKRNQIPLPFANLEEIEAKELAKVNADMIEVPCDTEDEIIAEAKDADVLLVVSAQITRQVLESLPKLKAVVRYGIGYDTIDVEAATNNRVLVVNILDFCLDEVSDHAIALLLTCAHQTAWMWQGIQQGHWSQVQANLAKVKPLYEQTLGLIGCGNIGRLTAKKAQAFKLTTIGYDPYIDKAKAEDSNITLVNLPDLLKVSDYISIHTPLTKETRHLIGERELRQMKPTAYLINAARGAVVDEAALIKALQGRYIAGVGLDVFEKEPIKSDNPLLKMKNVVLTPHVAGHSSSSMQRLRLLVAQQAAAVLTGKWPHNLVNRTVNPKITLG